MLETTGEKVRYILMNSGSHISLFFWFARHGRALTGASPEHAQVVGAVFVGVSVGSCVRVGGVFKLYSTEQNLVFVADCYFIRTNHRANAEGKTSGILSGACGRIL